MERKIEKWLLILLGGWNCLNGVLTILVYAPWFRQKGQALFRQHALQNYSSYSMMDSVVQLIFIFGLFLLVLGLVNSYLGLMKMGTSQRSKKMSAWVLLMLLVEVVMMDWIGILFILILTTIYFARNKSLKMKEVNG